MKKVVEHKSIRKIQKGKRRSCLRELPKRGARKLRLRQGPKSFCKRCPKLHNDVLHDENYKPKQRAQPSQLTVGAVTVSSLATKRTVRTKVPVKPTAAVKLYGPDGHYIEVRAVLDTQADVAMITEKVVQKLQLEMKPAYVTVTTYSGDRGARVLGEVEVKVSPQFNNGFEMTIEALVYKKLMAEVG